MNDARILRAQGVIAGGAAGDALGAGYEFGAAPLTGLPDMIGGGLGDFAPYQWTDDTTMAMAILHAAHQHGRLDTMPAWNTAAQDWLDWYESGPADIGVHTRAVLLDTATDGGELDAPAMRMLSHSAARHVETKRTAGNGSLMRTGPVALAHLDDPNGARDAAAVLSTLTHFDPVAAEACMLWTEAIRRAITGHGKPDWASIAVAVLHADAQAQWLAWIREAEAHMPGDFASRNGWVVGAFQGAWSAIHHTADYVPAVQLAVLGGGDTDTVATIAGSLAGALYGLAAVPPDWRDRLHGDGGTMEWAMWAARLLVTRTPGETV